MNVRWNTGIPAPKIRVKYTEIFVPTPGKPVEFILHGAWVDSLTVHWIGRSVPCLGDDCPSEVHAANAEARHFIAALHRVEKRQVVLSFSDKGLEDLAALRREHHCLLNLAVEVWRTLGKGGRHHVRTISVTASEAEKRHHTDPKPLLEAIWRRAAEKIVREGRP